MSLPKRRLGSGWTKGSNYKLFVLRELTSFFIGGYLVLFLGLLFTLIEGPAAYDAYVQCLGHPALLAFHGVAFVAAMLHSITWFNATPKAMAVWKPGGEERLEDWKVIVPNYLLLIGFTCVLIMVVMKWTKP